MEKSIHMKKSIPSISGLPRSHKVAGKKAYAKMKGIDLVIKRKIDDYKSK